MTELTSYLATLADGRSATVEADTLELARAAAALTFDLDALPTDAVVVPAPLASRTGGDA